MRLAVIPARGGSKRIPHKNIRHFCGRPMMAYVIETALQSGLFDHVIVSTDEASIAEVARQCGAEVPFMRPAALADDFTVIVDVMRHAVKWYEEQGDNVELACCLYATAPMLIAEDLIKGVRLVAEKQADFSLSVTHFAFPIQRALKMSLQGELSMFQPEHASTRSQDLEDAYHDAAQFYCGSREAFFTSEPTKTKGVFIPRYRVQDIDTEEDWVMAELMCKALHEREAKNV